MASWVKVAGGRRPPPSPNGGKVSGALPRSFRRAPYPLREDRNEEPKDREGFEPRYDDLNQEGDYSGDTNYEGYEQHPHSGFFKRQSFGQKSAFDLAAPSPKRYHPGEKRHALYRWFYKILEGGGGGKKSADCVVLAVNTQNPDYAKSLGLSLQERGLSVEMICLQAESGLTRALQDIRSDGSPLCILVEQTNVTLSSCTVIIFSESLKIHRNMPRDQALDFVLVEFGRVRDSLPCRDPGELAVRAAELADDYLAREKLQRHAVPADTRHLLLLLAEGVHLYPEELDTLSHFLHSRQEHLQEADAVPPLRNSLPPGMGSPPPLLPTPNISGPTGRDRPGPPPPSGMGEHSPGSIMGMPGTYPKSKPPPLLSMDSAPAPPHRPPGPHGPPPRGGPHGPRGFPPSRGPMGHHGPHPPRGPLMNRGPPPQNGPPQGPPSHAHGPRAPPPSLIAHHPPGLLPSPGPPPSRPPMPRH
ncbi:nuclear receptor coactivator 5 isoform X2 [Clupea harengus]|uniref:Nuclear receptor coactivator 5 isoform X2 n=1 Tax=Clupea harengus TaxID=7950 RepID=A0A6P8FAH3_CLUHA|nr:nuclear receptor coactivator 5 isoform X2 [Clupea harengus]